MVLTNSQMVFLFIVTEVLIWDVIRRGFYTIQHCATAKAYAKETKRQMDNLMAQNAYANLFNKNKEDKNE